MTPGTIQPGPWRGAGPSDNPKVIWIMGPERRSPWLWVRAWLASPKGSGVLPGSLANLRASAWLYALSSAAPALSWRTTLAIRQALRAGPT